MAGAESHVRLPADSTGKKMRTVKDTIGADEVHNEGVVVVDPTTTTQVLAVDAAGKIGLSSVSTGTAAANLGKAEDAAHSSGDVGVMALAVRQDHLEHESVDAEEDYTPLNVGEHGGLHVNAQILRHLEDMEATAGWTVLGNDTINLATTTNHVFETLALEFDKVDGADNTVFAGIQKTIAALNLTPYHVGGGFIITPYYLSSLADVDYVFLRLGTDNANYTEWRIEVDQLTTGWNNTRMIFGRPSAQAGVGWNSDVVTYIAVGVAFNLQNNALADIAVDHIDIQSGLHVNAAITAQISSDVSSPNVRVQKWRNQLVDLNQGNAAAGTLRVAIVDDDTNLATIAGDTTSIDGKIGREDLTIYSEDVAAGGAGDTELVAATADQKIKVYACGYESDADVVHQFRFATGTKKFGRRITAGIYCQTFVEPLVSAANETLNFRAEGAVNAKVWVQYVKE